MKSRCLAPCDRPVPRHVEFCLKHIKTIPDELYGELVGHRRPQRNDPGEFDPEAYRDHFRRALWFVRGGATRKAIKAPFSASKIHAMYGRN